MPDSSETGPKGKIGKATALWKSHGGLLGMVKGAPDAAGGAVKTFLFGGQENTDPKAPEAKLRRNEFVVDIDNKGKVHDKHGRRKDHDKRKNQEVKVETVYPKMQEFWVQHVERLAVVINNHPDLLNDKTSYIYHQYLQVKSFTTDPGPGKIGQVDMGRLQGYFQTAAGYNETMRYMEEELTRLEQANNIIELTKSGYKPDGLQGVDAGVVTKLQRVYAAGGLAIGSATFVGTVLEVAYIVSNLSVIAPGVAAAMVAAAPWMAGIVVGLIPVKIASNAINYAIPKYPQQIMQDCNAMFLAMSQHPQYESERTYLRGMYGIDPDELRFIPPPLNSPPGTSHKAVFMDDGTPDGGGITTGGWANSKELILKIKDTRRIFYDKVMDIEERSMFGVPEEAFFDNTGAYRNHVKPEGQAVIYQQEIWNRFKDLGGHFITDVGTGTYRRLTSTEAIQRFQQARREVIMAGTEVRGIAVIDGDRSRIFADQKGLIKKRKDAVGVTGEVRTDEQKVNTDIIALYKELNKGSDAKPGGLEAYVEEWKGTNAGSVESRLKGVDEVRREVYPEIVAVTAYTGQLSEISSANIQQAIAKLEAEINVKSNTVTGSLGASFEEIETKLSGPPPSPPMQKTRVTGTNPKTGQPYTEANEEYDRLVARQSKIEEAIEVVKLQIAKLKTLNQKLISERAKYDPTNEHGKAFAETLSKMETAYKKLVTAAANRGGTIAGTPPIVFDMDATAVENALRMYPNGTYTVNVVGATPPAQTRAATLPGLMMSLANESVPPLWNKDANDLHENKMTIIYAVAYARAQAEIAIAKADASLGSADYVTGGKKVHEVLDAGVNNGKFNEITIIANNATDLSDMGQVLVAGTSVDMQGNNNTTLRTYAQKRYEIYATTVKDLIEEHEKKVTVVAKQAEKIDEKYAGQEQRYKVIEDLIATEEGSDEGKKISSQVFSRGLTGTESVRHLTDLRKMANRTQQEQDKYQGYEQKFIRETGNFFPPAMLEFCDIVFNYRKNSEGEKLLWQIYEVLVDLNHDGVTIDRAPQITLADMIYESHPSIREMLNITPEEGKNHQTNSTPPVVLTETWDEIVLHAFQFRQEGFPPYGPPPHPVYRSSVPRPFTPSEMNHIFVSIQEQLIQKAINKGVAIQIP